jgi:hypothetical protein
MSHKIQGTIQAIVRLEVYVHSREPRYNVAPELALSRRTQRVSKTPPAINLVSFTPPGTMPDHLTELEGLEFDVGGDGGFRCTVGGY